MAKRARGLELGSETGCAPLKSMKHTLAKGSKGSQNQLANKLLALWSHGLISASLCQEFADLAMQDGAQHDELYALASTGNHGMCKATKKGRKPTKILLRAQAFFLPHLQFWSLELHFPENFNDLFSLAKGLSRIRLKL